MRLARFVLWSLAAAAGLASTATAQDSLTWESTATFGGVKAFLQVPGVKEELKLSPAQVQKTEQAIDRILMNHSADYTAIAALRNNPKAQAAKIDQVNKTLGTESMKALARILSDTQIKRYREVVLQVTGIDALSHAEVQKKLKLTKDQKYEIEKLLNSYLDKRKSLLDNPRVTKADRDKIVELHRDASTKAIALLEEQQKETWKDMIGKPFDRDKEPRDR